MKKIDFYTLVWNHENTIGVPYKVKVSGYQISENTAMYKNGTVWSVIDLATGRDISTKSYFTRKEAEENIQGVSAKELVGEDKYLEYMKAFSDAPIMGE